jgi:hypothetical protein
MLYLIFFIICALCFYIHAFIFYWNPDATYRLQFLVLLAITVILLAILAYNAYLHDYVVAWLAEANKVTTEVVTKNVTTEVVTKNVTSKEVTNNVTPTTVKTTDYYSYIGYGFGFVLGVGAAVCVLGLGLALIK